MAISRREHPLVLGLGLAMVLAPRVGHSRVYRVTIFDGNISARGSNGVGIGAGYGSGTGNSTMGNVTIVGGDIKTNRISGIGCSVGHSSV
jgi:hypothetical protein